MYEEQINIPVSDAPDWIPTPSLETVVTYNKEEDGLPEREVEKSDWD